MVTLAEVEELQKKSKDKKNKKKQKSRSKNKKKGNLFDTIKENAKLKLLRLKKDEIPNWFNLAINTKAIV